MEKFIDIHTHQQYFESEIFSIKNIIANKEHNIEQNQFYSVGLHPWYLNEANKATDYQLLTETANKKNILAIGEVGLDRITETDFELQIELLGRQILLAEKLKKPIIIHCVRAFYDIITVKKNLNPKVPFIIHGFNQNSEILSELIKHQFYISVGEAIFNENYKAHKLLKNIPENRLFLETDNSKISIKEIYKKASEILQISEKELIKRINQNFQAVFQHKI